MVRNKIDLNAFMDVIKLIIEGVVLGALNLVIIVMVTGWIMKATGHIN